jgi:hypothetical protein
VDYPFLSPLSDALASHRFRRVDDPTSDLLLKRQTFNTNRAVVVVSPATVPADFRTYMNAVSGGVAKRCGYIPFLWGIGIQFVAVAPGITELDPAHHVSLVDNQWAIVQSIFLVDPERGAYRSARTWGQFITGKFQDAIEAVLGQHFQLKP